MLRLLIVLSYLVAVALAHNARELGLLALLGLGFVPALKPRKALLALPFVLMALPLLFLTPGPVWQAGITHPGLHRFALLLARGALSLTALLWLTARPFPELLQALRQVGCPSVLVSLTGLVYRYLFVISDEAQRLMRARASRACGSPGLLYQAGTAGSMVGNLFLRSLERSERLYAAMQSRGYRGSFPAPPAAPVRPAHLLGWLAWVLVLAGSLWLA